MSAHDTPTGLVGRLSIDEDGAITASSDESYRTCTECGGDCIPETIAHDGLGIRWLFACPRHGAQSLVDPFAKLR